MLVFCRTKVHLGLFAVDLIIIGGILNILLVNVGDGLGYWVFHIFNAQLCFLRCTPVIYSQVILSCFSKRTNNYLKL